MDPVTGGLIVAGASYAVPKIIDFFSGPTDSGAAKSAAMRNAASTMAKYRDQSRRARLEMLQRTSGLMQPSRDMLNRVYGPGTAPNVQGLSAPLPLGSLHVRPPQPPPSYRVGDPVRGNAAGRPSAGLNPNAVPPGLRGQPAPPVKPPPMFTSHTTARGQRTY
jgi:hypothetical protein